MLLLFGKKPNIFQKYKKKKIQVNQISMNYCIKIKKDWTMLLSIHDLREV